MRKKIYHHWVVGCNVPTDKDWISWRLGCLEPFAVSSLELMMVFISTMTEESFYKGFGVGLAWSRKPRAQALPHSCCTMSKHIPLWEECLAAGIRRCHRWQGTCCVTPPPCCHHSSAQEPKQDHLPVLLNPCLTFTRLWWVSECFPVPFQHRELEATELPNRT